MGRPKLLLPWCGTTVLGHLLAQWQAVGAVPVAVVCADGDAAMTAELERLAVPPERRIINPHPARGMFSSVRCAAAWPGWDNGLAHVAIVLGDQPHLGFETLRKVAEFAAAHPDCICQPSRHGRRRHPVFLPTHLLASLATSNAVTLKEFLARAVDRVATIELDDPGLGFDLDTPADYERALRAFSG